MIIRISKYTLIHRNITFYDNLLSRIVLEFISTSAAALVIYFVLVTFEIFSPAYDFGEMMYGWLLMEVLGGDSIHLFWSFGDFRDF